jgi:hypothetical protein
MEKKPDPSRNPEDFGFVKNDLERFLSFFLGASNGLSRGANPTARGPLLSLTLDLSPVDFLRLFQKFPGRCGPNVPFRPFDVTEFDWKEDMSILASGQTRIFTKVDAEVFRSQECFRIRLCWDVQARILLNKGGVALDLANWEDSLAAFQASKAIDPGNAAKWDKYIRDLGPHPWEGTYAHERAHIKSVWQLIALELRPLGRLGRIIAQSSDYCLESEEIASRIADAIEAAFEATLISVIDAAAGHDAVPWTPQPPEGEPVWPDPAEPMPANSVEESTWDADQQLLKDQGYKPILPYPGW